MAEKETSITEKSRVEFRIFLACMFSVCTIVAVFYTKFGDVERRISVLETKMDIVIAQRASAYP